MNQTLAVEILSLFGLAIFFNVTAVFYTVCLNVDRITFFSEPIYTSSCDTFLKAAYICSKDKNCVMFSKDENQCAFFRSGINFATCERKASASHSSYFSVCDCKFDLGPWTKVGPLYLHVTPETYTCDQGQAVCSSLGGIMAEFHNTSEMDNAYTFITDSAFVGIDYLDGKYVWRTTGLEVIADMWAPGQPDGQPPCVQLWIRDYGLDDTGSSIYKHVLCEMRIP